MHEHCTSSSVHQPPMYECSGTVLALVCKRFAIVYKRRTRACAHALVRTSCICTSAQVVHAHSGTRAVFAQVCDTCTCADAENIVFARVFESWTGQ
eukprot:3580477-Pyramimonas_sp.AAC.1